MVGRLSLAFFVLNGDLLARRRLMTFHKAVENVLYSFCVYGFLKDVKSSPLKRIRAFVLAVFGTSLLKGLFFVIFDLYLK